jgi:hypothetical protein
VLVAENDVIAASRLLDGAVHDPLGGLSNLPGSNVEVFHGVGPLSR